MRCLLMTVVRMTRRWLPMLKRELGGQVEALVNRLEKSSSSCFPLHFGVSNHFLNLKK